MELGDKNGSIQICTIGFLVALHSDQNAISNRFCRTTDRHRQTDGRMDRIGMAMVDLDAARYELASIDKK